MDILRRICSSERKLECETILRLNDAPQEVALPPPKVAQMSFSKVAQNVILESSTKCHPRKSHKMSSPKYFIGDPVFHFISEFPQSLEMTKKIMEMTSQIFLTISEEFPYLMKVALLIGKV